MYNVIYIEESQDTGYYFEKNSLFLSLKINFDSADPFISVFTISQSTVNVLKFRTL